MKTYTIEPTYKKSVCEVELWRKPADIQPTDTSNEGLRYHFWNGPILRRECWWRWAEWTIDIPDTPSEISDFVQGQGFETLSQFFEHHDLDPDAESCTIEQVLLPDEDEDEHVLPSEAECLSCWDGQGEEFIIERTSNLELGQEECDRLVSEATRMYNEMYEEGLEELGWEHYSTIYEVYCTLNVTLKETEEEKQERELAEFRTTLKTKMAKNAETFGLLFEISNDDGVDRYDDEGNEITEYQWAIAKFGIDRVIDTIDACVPSNEPTCEGKHLAPFMVAASCQNSALAVIYHLLRKNPSSIE